MPSASPPPLIPSLHRHPSNVSSSSPSSTFDNAPGNHYLQQADPESELELELEREIPSPSSRSAFQSANNQRENSFNNHTSKSNSSSTYPTASSPRRTSASRTGSSSNVHSRSPVLNNNNRNQQNMPLPYGVPSFYHYARSSPYSNPYNPSDVELSMVGMDTGMSMYETLNPLAATMMASSPSPGGKKGLYAPIDASYYSPYTQAGGMPGAYPGAESVQGNLGFSTMMPGGYGAKTVNPRYISGKSEGAVNTARDRESVLKRVRRDASVFEEELKRLVEEQEVALGIVPDASAASERNVAQAYANVGSAGERGFKAGESVYTTRSKLSASAMNGSSRRKRRMGIKDVRRGILDAMVGLADVKSVEEDWYASEVGARVDLVDTVERWTRKRGKLEREVERVESGEEGREMDRIRERLEGVEEQIRVHETELKRLRGEQAEMLGKISDLQSTLSSRLSSYTSSIQKMSKDMTAFLRSPNALLPTPDTKATLPFTPEQAIDFWRDERKVLDAKKKDTGREIDALKDGILVWQETVGLIADFEGVMAKELADVQKRDAEAEAERIKLERSRSPQKRNSLLGRGLETERPGSSSASSGRNTPVSVFANRNRRGLGQQGHSRNGSLSSSTETFKPGTGKNQQQQQQQRPGMPEATAATLVAGIDNVISQLNSRLTLAEQKGWTLLVCILGAEMESYKEARAALVPLMGSLVDTSTTTETPQRVAGTLKGKEPATAVSMGGLTSPSDDALNESLNGLSMGGTDQSHAFEGLASNSGVHGQGLQNNQVNHWNSESESEIDDPAALFGAEQSADDDGSSSPELRMSPRMRRLRSKSEEEDELEYAAFASLNLAADNQNNNNIIDSVTTPTAIPGGRGSGKNTVIGESVRKASGSGEESDIHGAFLER